MLSPTTGFCFQALTNNCYLPLPCNSAGLPVGLWTDPLSCPNPACMPATMLTLLSTPSAQLKHTHRRLGIALFTLQPDTGRVLQTHTAQKPSTTGTHQVTKRLPSWSLGKRGDGQGNSPFPYQGFTQDPVKSYLCLLDGWSGLIYL